MKVSKCPIQVYSAAPNIVGISSTAASTYPDNLEPDSCLVERLTQARGGLLNIRELYPELLDESTGNSIVNALMLLTEKQVVDWVAYTIYNSKENLVLQEWRYEIQISSSSSVSDPPPTRKLSKIPFLRLENLSTNTIFICHTHWSSNFSSLSSDEKFSIVNDIPWLASNNPNTKRVEKNNYPGNTWWHTSSWYEAGIYIPLNKQSIKTSVTWKNIEWEPIVSFPGKCVKGENYELQLIFRLKNLNGSKLYNEELILLVIITGEDFDLIGSYYQPVKIPFDQNSNKVVFQLSPKTDVEFGDKEIIIDFFSNARRVGNMVVKTKISNPRYEEQYDIIGSPISREVINRAPSRLSRKQLTLTVASQRDGLQYDIFESKLPQELGCGKKINKDEIRKYIDSFLSMTSKFVGKEYTQEDYESIKIQLQAQGEKIYNLFPTKFHDYFSDLEDGSIIQIHHRDELQWIPWEIVYDGSRFWGEKFIITRLPKSIVSKGEATGTIAFFTRILHFLSTDISKSEENINKAEKSFSEFNPSYVNCIKNSSLAELKHKLLNLDKPNLIHFTCHGGESKEDDSILYLGRRGKETEILSVDTIGQLKFDQTIFVFANACVSARLAYSLWGEFISFGSAFLREGVLIFVGTIGTIPVLPAVEFAEALYQNILSGKFSIGEALWITKQSFKTRNNPFWLFYCLYGDATLNLRWESLDDSLPESCI